MGACAGIVHSTFLNYYASRYIEQHNSSIFEALRQCAICSPMAFICKDNMNSIDFLRLLL